MNSVTWRVPDGHPVFAGHFPGRPIVPGVLLLDRAILAASETLGRPVSGCRIVNAKFFSPVGPGETLTFTFSEKAGGAIQCAIRAADRDVASMVLDWPKP
jgi:3-hydroxymyristoyl/3-hydroxydecanoyl-(acyl carrier protein) dehydratase